MACMLPHSVHYPYWWHSVTPVLWRCPQVVLVWESITDYVWTWGVRRATQLTKNQSTNQIKWVNKPILLVLNTCPLGCTILAKVLHFVALIWGPITKDILGRFLHFKSFWATLTILQLTWKYCYILIIFALREDLICHSTTTYCLRYQGDRVLFRLFCFIYQSVMLVHILNEIATLWVIMHASLLLSKACTV